MVFVQYAQNVQLYHLMGNHATLKYVFQGKSFCLTFNVECALHIQHSGLFQVHVLELVNLSIVHQVTKLNLTGLVLSAHYAQKYHMMEKHVLLKHVRPVKF